MQAAVRAMDTVQDYVSAELGINIEQFALAGGSKVGCFITF